MAALHRRARCINPLPDVGSVADGVAEPVAAAALQRHRSMYRALLAAAVVEAASLRFSLTHSLSLSSLALLFHVGLLAPLIA